MRKGEGERERERERERDRETETYICTALTAKSHIGWYAKVKGN